MVLRVWCFECQRCKCRIWLCTRCLGRRRYCGACAVQVGRAQDRESGRKYQRTAKGRRSHRRRNRRYRRGQHERRRAGRSGRGAEAGRAAAPAPAAAATPTATTPAPSETSAPETPAPEPTRVTQAIRGPESRLSARVESAPRVAAVWVTGTRGAEEPGNAEGRAGQAAQASVEGGVEAHESARARPAAAPAAPQWPRPAGAQPVLARCSCCRRIGEVVFFDGRLAVMRGPDPG